MARVGTKTLLHYVLHKFNKSNPTALINKNFLIMGVKLKIFTITWYLRNYKAKIKMRYNVSYVCISLGCLRIIINFTFDKALKYVTFKIQHGKEAITFTLENAEDYEGDGPADIAIRILRSDLAPGKMTEADYSGRRFQEPKLHVILEDSYRWHRNGLLLEKVIKANTINETFMLLYEQLEDMRVDMIRFYKSHCDL